MGGQFASEKERLLAGTIHLDIPFDYEKKTRSREPKISETEAVSAELKNLIAEIKAELDRKRDVSF